MRDIEGLFSRKQRYRDFDVRFKRNPITNDLLAKGDVDSIKQSVHLLVMTQFYERPFQPEIGTTLASALFESFDSENVRSIPEEIRRFLTKYEPRILVKNVTTTGLEGLDSNSLDVRIEYLIVETNNKIDQQIILKRVR